MWGLIVAILGVIILCLLADIGNKSDKIKRLEYEKQILINQVLDKINDKQ